MQDRLIKALAEVLEVNLADYEDMTKQELLSTLEDMQAQELAAV